jgi:hypothetical protein
MDPSARDRSTVDRSLDAVGERLRALGALLDTGGEVGALRGAVASALDALQEAHAIVADPREAQRVACPHCGYRIMPDATLCLSCWRKHVPPSTA